MNQIRISLFTLIMSLAVHSNVHGSQYHNAYDSHYHFVDPYLDNMNNLIMNAPSINEGGQAQLAVQNTLEHCLDVNTQSIHGDTLLHTAVTHARLDIVNLLLEKRPDLDINVTNHKKMTPIEYTLQNIYTYCSIAKKNKYLAILRLLVSSNATCPDLTDINCLESFNDKDWYDKDDEFRNVHFYCDFKSAYDAGKEICMQREKEKTAYEQAVANRIDQYIPVKDLNNIITEYTDKMSVLQFVHMQKEQTQTTEEKTN